MVSLADALLVLYPALDLSAPDAKAAVSDDGSGAVLARWDESTLGPAPTVEQIAGVTEEQVEAAVQAKVRASAGAGLVGRDDDLAVGIRVMFRVVIDRHNTICRRLGYTDLILVEPDVFGLVAQALASGLGDPGVRSDLTGTP